MITFKHLHLKNVIEDFQTYNSIEILKEKAILSKLHTKQLLKLRVKFYSMHSGGRWNFDYYESVVSYWVYPYGKVWIRESLLKQELDSREHIPNKQESRQIRQAKHSKQGN